MKHRLKLTSLLASGLLSLTLLNVPCSFAGEDDGSMHLDWMDFSIDPGDTFYEYATGNWLKNNPIPPAYGRWGIFQLLDQQNLERVHQLVMDAASKPQLPGSDAQKIGDFYTSGMDEVAINKMGFMPLQREFKLIDEVKNRSELQKEIAHLQMIGVNAVFAFGSMQDFKNSDQVIGAAMQAGLGLPDRDYYLKEDDKFKQIRQFYQQHVSNMFELVGDDKAKSMQEAKTVMMMETALAQVSMSKISMRDPNAIYHIMDLKALHETTPNFCWHQFFADMGHSEIKSINLATPEFFKFMNKQLMEVSLEDWKTYLRWHLIQSFASYLSQPFVDEKFRMTSILTGAKELHPRWKRVVSTEEDALGYAIGKLYVEKYFPSSAKQYVAEILKDIRAALKADLENLAWMTPATRQAALEKLNLMDARIGYPDKWRDYSALQVEKGPYVTNVIHANEFLNKRDFDKIGKPVDKTEWEMTPQTVNAYYDPSTNRLNLPAGILQAPFFDAKATDAMNYGGIGFVIGHEMTHGFDDEGAQFDGYGNLNNWWADTDLEQFKAATKCISDQFSEYTVADGLHVQGDLVVGEATADLGGLILAYRAFRNSPGYENAKVISGFTPDQQFFLASAYGWAMNVKPEEERRLVLTDPHPPAKYRVNGTLSNMGEFQKAFNIPAGKPMVNSKLCIIW